MYGLSSVRMCVKCNLRILRNTNTRSAKDQRVEIPYRKTSLGVRAWDRVGLSLYNDLPIEIKTKKNRSCFAYCVKHYIRKNWQGIERALTQFEASNKINGRIFHC